MCTSGADKFWELMIFYSWVDDIQEYTLYRPYCFFIVTMKLMSDTKKIPKVGESHYAQQINYVKMKA